MVIWYHICIVIYVSEQDNQPTKKKGKIMENTTNQTDDFLDMGQLFFGTPIEVSETLNDDGSEAYDLTAGDPDYQA